MVAISSNLQGKSVRGQRIFVLKGMRWETYQALRADVGDRRAWRIAYDGELLSL